MRNYSPLNMKINRSKIFIIIIVIKYLNGDIWKSLEKIF